MSNKPWKRTERVLAKRLGATRVGCTGYRTADVINGWLAVEVKHRKQLPSWLKEALGQMVRTAKDEQLAIVVLHETGMRHDDDLVVLRLGDFQDWLGEVRAERRGEDNADLGAARRAGG